MNIRINDTKEFNDDIVRRDVKQNSTKQNTDKKKIVVGNVLQSLVKSVK